MAFIDIDGEKLAIGDTVEVADDKFEGPLKIHDLNLTVEEFGRTKITVSAEGHKNKWQVTPSTVRKVNPAEETEPAVDESAAEETIPVRVADDFQSRQDRIRDVVAAQFESRQQFNQKDIYTLEQLEAFARAAGTAMTSEARQEIREQLGLTAAPADVLRTSLPGPGIWEVGENGRCTPLVPKKTEAAPEPVVLGSGFICVAELDEEPGVLIPQGPNLSASKETAANHGYRAWFSRMIDRTTKKPSDVAHYDKVTKLLQAGEAYVDGPATLRLVSANIVLS
ncbi:hypothetical protein AB0G15_05695 [Streptosporangium sp. NPDC023825]|uniref:hypothetical protein n=1 Tax=Streptosporangium sp. NPDC023825 TaxID=3154909 RepID=UPI00344985B9